MLDRLALDGGKPVRANFLKFHTPSLSLDEENEVVNVIRSGWITMGPKTRDFEIEFAKHSGSRYAIAVNSCTSALHLALVVSGVGRGHEVIMSPITFASTANVVVHQGAVPVFVDVEPDTLNMDVDKLETLITPRTKVIVAVHFAGHPVDMDPLVVLAKKHGLVIVEDAAHAIEAEYRGKKAGTLGDMAAFSFYANKNITTGEGGMLTTNDSTLSERLSLLRLHGMSHDAWNRYGSEGYKHWDIIYPGFKYNMSDIQAALGLVQLKRINDMWLKRSALKEQYDRAFADIDEIITLRSREYVKNAYHLYPIMIRSEKLKVDRDRFMDAIQAENVGVGVHFRAVHLHPYYSNTFGFTRGYCPIAEHASDRLLSLPLYPQMTEDDVQDVINVVRKVIISLKK